MDGEINYSNTSEALLYNASFSGNTVTVFPNPSTGGKVNFEWTSRISENIRIAINDLNGKLILQTEIQTEKGKNTTQINTETWASGMYFFAISGNNTLTGKFLVK